MGVVHWRISKDLSAGRCFQKKGVSADSGPKLATSRYRPRALREDRWGLGCGNWECKATNVRQI